MAKKLIVGLVLAVAMGAAMFACHRFARMCQAARSGVTTPASGSEQQGCRAEHAPDAGDARVAA